MSYLELNRTHDKMPIVGFGLWQIPDGEAGDAVYNAIKAGYRLFDGAAVYANEKGVGSGIARALKEGIVKREDLFLVSKLWNTFHHKDHVRAGLDRTLKDLGIDYIDLYLIHFPISLDYVNPEVQYPAAWVQSGESKVRLERSPIQDCWREMEKLVDAGLARNIGVSNFNTQALLDLFTYCKYKPATLQIERHPYLQQNRIIEWVKQEGLQVTAYSSFGAASYIGLLGISAKPLMENDVIKAISQKHNKTPAQVLLRWSVQQNVAIIPKSLKAERMETNKSVLDWSLDASDMEQIAQLDSNIRYNDPKEYGVDIPLFE